MFELRRKCVQTMPALAFDGERAVQPVVDDVHAGEGQLCAYLVRYPSVDGDFEKRAVFAADRSLGDGTKRRLRMERLELCALGVRQAVVFGVDHSAERQCRVVRKVVLKGATCSYRSFYQREIRLFYRLPGELRTQVREGVGSAGE